MTIKEMQDKVIHVWGFEHPATIYFFEECERAAGDMLLIKSAFEFAMSWIDSDEDEQI